VLVHGVGLTTELALATTRGTVIDRGDCLVVRTPDDPSFYDGNLVVFGSHPRPGEIATWTARFAAELPDIPYRAFRWDGPPGDPGELLTAGFTVDVHEVMVADDLIAPPASLPIRALSPEAVVASHSLAFAMGEHHHDSYRTFLRRRAAWHASLVARGDARFWGAFDGDTLVATAGLVELGELARFQDVRTAQAYRRRGLAGALLAAAATGTRASRLVIVVQPDSAAAHLYERVGFRSVERTATAWRPAPEISG
jgi:ribosomal protein S18 acetylase RimI-like enzyme